MGVLPFRLRWQSGWPRPFGSTPEFWLRLQLNYDLAQVRAKAGIRFRSNVTYPHKRGELAP